MNEKNLHHYQRIETAIHFILENFQSQPSLEELAEAVNLSPFHFQRLFSDWAGVSPKKFMQYISITHAKGLLEQRRSLTEVALDTGLSSTGRLHDLFVKIEGMTPGEFKNGGENLAINYSFSDSPFGAIIIGSTDKGICHLFFEENENKALNDLKSRFPNAHYQEQTDALQEKALLIFHKDWQKLDGIKLHLSGTAFQLKVWESLLKIPRGALSSYGDIAADIGQVKSSRAVGSAIGRNPIAFLIPCHRVIQQSGRFGGYMWGENRKAAIIGWEAAKAAEQ